MRWRDRVLIWQKAGAENNEDHKYYFIDISEEFGRFLLHFTTEGNTSLGVRWKNPLWSTIRAIRASSSGSSGRMRGLDLILQYFLWVWLISVISPRPLSGQTPANADQNNLFSSVSIFHPPLSPRWSVVTSAAVRPDTEATFTFILYLTRPKGH